jgi:RloB-like protein
LSGPPRRTKLVTAPKKRILVFTEGQATEPIYLNYWYRLHRESVIVVIDDRHGAPMTLVSAAVAERKQQMIDTKRGRGTGFDEYWCVLDVDEHPHLDKALRLARDNEIKVALSNPCIELWFVLHAEDQTSFVDRAVIQRRCRTLLGFDKRPTQDALEAMRAGYSVAKDRSDALIKMHRRNGSLDGANPTTTVALLVQSIRGTQASTKPR